MLRGAAETMTVTPPPVLNEPSCRECVCEREREGERAIHRESEREKERKGVCVCVRERGRGRDIYRERAVTPPPVLNEPSCRVGLGFRESGPLTGVPRS